MMPVRLKDLTAEDTEKKTREIQSRSMKVSAISRHYPL